MSGRGKSVQDRWCVLRTSGRNTLSLADALTRDGFNAWAPRGLPDLLNGQDQSSRRPRSRGRRRRAVSVELVPILATYVFALEHHLDDLVALSESEDFSVMCDNMRHRGFALIADASLRPLRTLEESLKAKAERMRPRGAVLPFGRGDEVRVPSGAYAGLSGLVESSDGKKTWLDFGGVMGRVQIETFVLRPSEERMAA